MKARIADELARSDLTSQIALAIDTAIQAYFDEPLFLTQTPNTGLTFQTVVNQEWYDDNDNPDISNLNYIEWAKVQIAVGNEWRLERRRPMDVDYDSGNTSSLGQPYDYVQYSRQLRLYPTPNQIWTVSVFGTLRRPPPANDAETGNLWMTEAEPLIRSRAKYELASHVIRDPGLAIAMSPDVPPPGKQVGHEAYRWFEKLKGDTTSREAVGRVRRFA